MTRHIESLRTDEGHRVEYIDHCVSRAAICVFVWAAVFSMVAYFW